MGEGQRTCRSATEHARSSPGAGAREQLSPCGRPFWLGTAPGWTCMVQHRHRKLSAHVQCKRGEGAEGETQTNELAQQSRQRRPALGILRIIHEPPCQTTTGTCRGSPSKCNAMGDLRNNNGPSASRENLSPRDARCLHQATAASAGRRAASNQQQHPAVGSRPGGRQQPAAGGSSSQRHPKAEGRSKSSRQPAARNNQIATDSGRRPAAANRQQATMRKLGRATRFSIPMRPDEG